jgi:hypothetical protein
MASSNVIPFRKRRPSDGEMAAYRMFTRNWSPELRQLMFPDYFREESEPRQAGAQRLLPSPG